MHNDILRSRYAYTSDSSVAALAASVLPYYLYTQSCSSIAFGFRGCLEGCGKQKAFAFASISGWYLVGIPAAMLNVFYFKLGLFGVWAGMDVGNTCVVGLMTRAGMKLDWKVEANKARQKSRGGA